MRPTISRSPCTRTSATCAEVSPVTGSVPAGAPVPGGVHRTTAEVARGPTGRHHHRTARRHRPHLRPGRVDAGDVALLLLVVDRAQGPDDFALLGVEAELVVVVVLVVVLVLGPLTQLDEDELALGVEAEPDEPGPEEGLDDKLERQTVNVSGPEAITYSEACKRTAKVLKKSCVMLPSLVMAQFSKAQEQERSSKEAILTRTLIRMIADGDQQPVDPCDQLPGDLVPKSLFNDEQIIRALG